MDQHVKVVGAFYIIFGGIGLLTALGIVLFFGGLGGVVGIVASDEPAALLALPFIGAIGGVALLLTLTMAVPRIIAGFALLQYRPWGRVLALALAVVGLINFPFGTALSFYSLWVLLSPGGRRLFVPDPAPPPVPPIA
jgi:hypothetical protein